jgi:hypothetical protein
VDGMSGHRRVSLRGLGRSVVLVPTVDPAADIDGW